MSVQYMGETRASLMAPIQSAEQSGDGSDGEQSAGRSVTLYAQMENRDVRDSTINVHIYTLSSHP